jgi:hypothetical protein
MSDADENKTAHNPGETRESCTAALRSSNWAGTPSGASPPGRVALVGRSQVDRQDLELPGATLPSISRAVGFRCGWTLSRTRLRDIQAKPQSSRPSYPAPTFVCLD